MLKSTRLASRAEKERKTILGYFPLAFPFLIGAFLAHEKSVSVSFWKPKKANDFLNVKNVENRR